MVEIIVASLSRVRVVHGVENELLRNLVAFQKMAPSTISLVRKISMKMVGGNIHRLISIKPLVRLVGKMKVQKLT